MRRSLSLKLTLAVVLVSLISIGLVAVITQIMTESEFDKMLLERRQARLIEQIQEYYEANGSLDGVETLFDDSGLSIAGTLVLMDMEGKVLFPPSEHPTGEPDPKLPSFRLNRGIPIVVDGQRIAYMMTTEPRDWRRPEDDLTLRRINTGLWLAAGGATVFAIVVGIILSQMLTRPLRELTKATHAIAQGDLEQQVPVRTKDELGELAISFNHMSRDLARSITLRKQMTADIAHDLRTPLTVIKGYTEALRDGDLPATHDTFEVMYQESSLLSHLIDDLRMLSLADAGELTLNKRETSVMELLDQVRMAYLPQAQRAGVTIVLRIEDDIPLIEVDPERMSRVLTNLVSNALRYTPEGGEITLWARKVAQAVCLGVTDTGAGIAPEDLPNVFERFYRGDLARSEGGESGLGLPIARSLVEAHGGTISARSDVGEGTTFQIKLSV